MGTVDTGIHQFGWTRAQAMAYLKRHAALSDHEITTEAVGARRTHGPVHRRRREKHYVFEATPVVEIVGAIRGECTQRPDRPRLRRPGAQVLTRLVLPSLYRHIEQRILG